jgi:tetratricopeptide (TPR) repeat protein
MIRKLLNNWIKEISEILIQSEIDIIENKIKDTSLNIINFMDIVLYSFGCKKSKDNIIANRNRTEKKYSLMSSLASIYAENDEIDRACNYYEIVFKGRKEILGNTHPSLLHTQGNLALMYKKKNKFEESLELYKVCLNAKNEILGPNHPSTYNTVYNYSVLLKELNKYEDALPLLYISLDNQEDKLGKEHLDTIRTCEYIGTILIEQGDMLEAKKYLLRSMNSNIKLYGKYNKETLHSMETIAEILFVENNYDESILLYEDILKRYDEIEKNVELNIEITYITRKRLAIIYKTITRYNDAILGFENILQFELKKLSKLHVYTIETYTLLAESFKLNTDLNNHLHQSELNYRILLSCHVEMYSKDDIKTVNIKYQLASILSEMEQYDESKCLHEEVLEQRRILLGDKHIDTLVSIFCLANDELIFHNYERCYYLFQESLSGFDNLLGEDHIHSIATCESYLSLAKLLKDNKTSETLVSIFHFQFQFLFQNYYFQSLIYFSFT